jgi:hypothetical protein
MPKYANIQRCPQNSREHIAEGIAKGLESVMQGYVKGQEKKKDQEIFEKLQNPELSPIARATLASQLSAGSQKALSAQLDFENKFARRNELSDRAQQEQEFKQSKENRLGTQNSVKDLQRLYQNKLSALKDQIKDTFREGDKKPLRDQQSALQKELGVNLKRLREGKRPEFRHLDVEEEPMASQQASVESSNQMGMQGQQQQQMQQAPQGMQQPQSGQPARQRWNPQDPAHQQRALQILQQANGDRGLANQALMQEFER